MTKQSPDGVALFDVNFLVALAMPNHVSHHVAQSWFSFHAGDGWATTAITENGFVRVCSNRSAIASATAPATALEMLTLLTSEPTHYFWPDAVEAVVGPHLPAAAITTYRQVTDAHLLALVTAYQGQLVTFDRGITALGGDPRRLVVLAT